MAFGLGSAVVSELILVALIAVALFLIFKIGKFILKIIFGIVINSILGLIAIYALNYIFNIGIPIELATMLPTALFGLPAVGTMIILRLFGISI